MPTYSKGKQRIIDINYREWLEGNKKQALRKRERKVALYSLYS